MESNEVPEDVLAEQDAEVRREGHDPSVQGGMANRVPEDILVERYAEELAAERAASPRTDDQIVEIEEQ